MFAKILPRELYVAKRYALTTTDFIARGVRADNLAPSITHFLRGSGERTRGARESDPRAPISTRLGRKTTNFVELRTGVGET